MVSLGGDPRTLWSGEGVECVGQEGKEANKGCAIKNCGQLWAQPAGDSGK